MLLTCNLETADGKEFKTPIALTVNAVGDGKRFFSGLKGQLDLTLLGVSKNVTYQPASLAYSAGNTVLTLTFNGLPEDAYVLTLLSGDQHFEARGQQPAEVLAHVGVVVHQQHGCSVVGR